MYVANNTAAFHRLNHQTFIRSTVARKLLVYATELRFIGENR